MSVHNFSTSVNLKIQEIKTNFETSQYNYNIILTCGSKEHLLDSVELFNQFEAKSVKGFMSYDRITKQTEITCII